MNRGVGLAGAAVVACLAFLGGHALAGTDGEPAKAAPKSPKLGPAPEVIASAARAVALPVISVRQLPVLAPPHRKKVTAAPVIKAADPVTPVITPQPTPNPTPQPSKPQTTPPSGGNGGSGGGGYFDDSG